MDSWPTIRLRSALLFLGLLLFSAAQFLGAGCKSKTPPETRIQDADRVRHLRVDSGAEPMQDVARLHSLYLPGASMVDDNTQTLQADARGLILVPEAIGEEECVDVLIDVPQDDAHSAFIAMFTRVSAQADEASPALSADRQQLLAYDTHDSSAWILPHICPHAAETVQIVIRGQAKQTYQLQIHRRTSDAVDRALYARARRDLPGFRGYGPVQRDVLQNNARLSLPLAISGDHCIAIAAYAEDGLHDLDARFLSLNGDQLALEVATDRASVLGPYCPLSDEIIRVEFRAYQGQGAFRWQRWESALDIGNQLIEARMRSADGHTSETTIRDIVDRVLQPLRAKH